MTVSNVIPVPAGAPAESGREGASTAGDDFASALRRLLEPQPPDGGTADTITGGSALPTPSADLVVPSGSSTLSATAPGATDLPVDPAPIAGQPSELTLTAAPARQVVAVATASPASLATAGAGGVAASGGGGTASAGPDFGTAGVFTPGGTAPVPVSSAGPHTVPLTTGAAPSDVPVTAGPPAQAVAGAVTTGASTDPTPVAPAPTDGPASGPVTATTVGASGPAATTPAAGASPTTSGPAVTGQVFPQVTHLVGRGDGRHSITLRLHPADLGEVRVTVTVKNGAVDVTMAAGAEARQALRSGSGELRSLLELAGAATGTVVIRELPGTTASGAASGLPTSAGDPQGAGTSADAEARTGADTHGRRESGDRARDGTSQSGLPGRPDGGAESVPQSARDVGTPASLDLTL